MSTKTKKPVNHGKVAKDAYAVIFDIGTQLKKLVEENVVNVDEYSELFRLVQKLKKIQSKFPKKRQPPAPKDALAQLKGWFLENGGILDGVTPGSGFKEGNGMKATAPIEKEKVVLRVPYTEMFTECDAKQIVRPLGRTALTSTYLAFSLALMKERMNTSSKFLAYLYALPETVDNPLFFSYEAIRALKGSRAQIEALAMIKTVLSQYIFYYQQFFEGESNFFKPEEFSYEEFAWANAIVITRQNKIIKPKDLCGIHPEDTRISALIPVWDLCNHNEGKPNSFISELETGKKLPESKKFFLTCKAQRNYDKGEQFFMSYGEDRSSMDYLITGGFLPEKQETNDFLPIIIPAKPKGYPGAWAEILSASKVNLENHDSRTFSLNVNGTPSPSLLAVLIVFDMSQQEVEEFPKGEDILEHATKAQHDKANCRIAFIVRKMLSEYPETTAEEAALAKTDLSLRNALKLRRLETTILRNALDALNLPTNGKLVEELTPKEKKKFEEHLKKKAELLRSNDLMTGFTDDMLE